MDYAASQTLVSDLLGDGSNFDLHDSNLNQSRGFPTQEQTDLHEPGLWSESESSVGSDEDPDLDMLDAGLSQIKEDVRGAVRFKSRKAKKAPKKGRRAAETLPTFEIQGLLGQANQLFVAGQIDDAQSILEEIIRIDYNVFAAWQLLGEVHKDKGDINKCLTAWMTAAHLRPRESELWMACASMSIQSGLIDQADYCYNKLSRAKPQDVDILWDRALLNHDHGRNKKAIEIYKQLLKLVPHEMTTTRELARLYFDEGRVEDAIMLYETTSDFYVNGVDRKAFNWSELNIMAELYMTAATNAGRSELWRNFISRVKTVARWLCGRQYETWWNDRADDAEWDADNSRRRSEPRFVISPNSGAYNLPLDIRVKLGKARLNLKEKPEAMKHFDFLDDSIVREQPDLLLEVGDALLQAESWEDALEFYSKLTDCDETNGPDLWLSMAKAFRYTEDYVQAEECLDYVLASDHTNTNAMVLLAEVYEITDRRQDALETINRVIELRRSVDELDTGTIADDLFSVIDEEETTFFKKDRIDTSKRNTIGSSKRRSHKRAPTRRTEDLVAYEERKTEETRNKFKFLELSRPGMLANDPIATEQWMASASDLIDDFRNIRYFYPSERRHIFQGLIRPKKQKITGSVADSTQLQGIADRLEDSITAGQAVLRTVAQLEELRGYHFLLWLEVFIQYAILLVDAGDSDEAFSVLEAAYSANVFYQSHSSFMRLHIAKMILTIRAKDAKTGADEARWMMLNCLFRDDGQRLYGTVLSSGSLAAEVFRDNANQKFMLRLVKTMDSVINNTTIAGTVSLKDLEDRPESIRPRHVHCVLVMLYGQIVAAGRGYVASLQYFTRAFAFAPDDPLVLFSLGLSYLHRSMQRQSDNRHLQIVQALSFLLRYSAKRKAMQDPAFAQEAEYNMGRALHQLGLPHLALAHYERVLNTEGINAEHDLKWHAAYNMQLIHVLAGNTQRAKEITKCYLVI